MSTKFSTHAFRSNRHLTFVIVIAFLTYGLTAYASGPRLVVNTDPVEITVYLHIKGSSTIVPYDPEATP